MVSQTKRRVMHAVPTLPTAPAGVAVDMQQGLEALPQAAAVVAGGGGECRLIACNTRFRHIGEQMPLLSGDDALTQLCRAALDGGTGRTNMIWEQGGLSGRVYEATAAPLVVPAVGPAVLLSLIDRTTLARSEANLRRELLSDSLTGLPNRSGFGDILEQRARAGSAQPPQTLLVVDLLRFSRINESIGALAGDELLLTVANRLKHQCRSGDVLARISGDEFAVLGATQGSAADAGRMAERLRGAFDEPFRVGDMLINIDCAVGGIARLFGADQDAATEGPDLIRHALIALKQAKRQDKVAFYEPRTLARLHQRFDRETALRRAIEQDQIDLAFQPLVDMKRRRIVGFEALARWTCDGEVISPGEFVPIAEDSGLIVPMGRRIIDKALRTLAAWDRAHGAVVPVSMSVNVSPIQLARDDIVAVVRTALADNGVDGDRLAIEVTESSVVENADSAEAVLRALSAQNVRVAMDDFGTGYSNIANLQRLPIHTLKIDRSLVVGIDNSADSLAIVRTIQRLAEALGLQTTAEGIETETVAQQVAAIGCTNGQGYLFSRPLDADAAFAAWQASHRR